MLPRKYRLTSEKDIERVFKKGRGMRMSGFGIRRVNNGGLCSRFAFVVGTKTSKKAVIRNKLKRQMRAIVHENISLITPGFDVVIMAQKETIDVDFDKKRLILNRILQKTGLLKSV